MKGMHPFDPTKELSSNPRNAQQGITIAMEEDRSKRVAAIAAKRAAALLATIRGGATADVSQERTK